MKIKVLMTMVFCLGAQLASADIYCADASGYYGYVTVTEKSNNLEILAIQGYSYEISKQLGFPMGAEASALLISMPRAQCVGSGMLLHCQGPTTVQYNTFTKGPGKLEAIIDFQVSQESNGHTVTLGLTVPSLNKKGLASHHFAPGFGGNGCKER